MSRHPISVNSLPYAPGNLTSQQAAEKTRASAASQVEAVFQFIQERGSFGAMEDEVAAALGLNRPASTARMRDLKDRRMIGSAHIWRTTRSGHDAEVFVALDRSQWVEKPDRSQKAQKASLYAVAIDLDSQCLTAAGPFREQLSLHAELRRLLRQSGRWILFAVEIDSRGNMTATGPIRPNGQEKARAAKAAGADGFLFDVTPAATEHGL